MFYFLAVLVLLLLLVSIVVQRKIFLNKLKRFPVKDSLPVLGHLKYAKDPTKLLKNMLNYCQSCGDNPIFFVGTHPTILVTEPKMMEFVLSSNQLLDKSQEYEYFKIWFGDGLLTSPGTKSKTTRKMLMPSFHYKILEEYVEIFDSASHVLLKNLKQESENSFDINKYITLYTLDVICETAMGYKINAQDNPTSKFVENAKLMCKLIHEKWAILPYNFYPYYRLTSNYKKEVQTIKALREFSDHVINERRKIIEKNGDADLFDEFGIKKKSNFLDTLLKANLNGAKLTHENIRNEVDTFIFGGNDTTAVAISCALYLLSKHADVQQKAFDEIKKVFGSDKQRSIKYEDLQNLKYMELIIKETLRIYPSIPLFGRLIKEDIIFDGQVLPKGVGIAAFPYVMHRNKNLYPEPEKFIPERFTIENSSDRHPYAHVPFSAGPRNCIGQKFAMLEMKSVISKILRHFVLISDQTHNISTIYALTLQSTTGMKMRIKPRVY